MVAVVSIVLSVAFALFIGSATSQRARPLVIDGPDMNLAGSILFIGPSIVYARKIYEHGGIVVLSAPVMTALMENGIWTSARPIAKKPCVTITGDALITVWIGNYSETVPGTIVINPSGTVQVISSQYVFVNAQVGWTARIPAYSACAGPDLSVIWILILLFWLLVFYIRPEYFLGLW